MNISAQYLEALRTIAGWATVSEWALKFGEMYPELLEKANKEAENQKTPSTGIREIAARISSTISRGAYIGKIEIDEAERPRKVRFLTPEDASSYIEKEIEDDTAPLTRGQKIKDDFSLLSTKDAYRVAEFEAIIGQLRHFFSLDFELEHAKALLNREDPGSHHPDNLQLLLKTHNRIKNSDNWARFTLDEQINYIQSVVQVQKLVSIKMGVHIEDDVIESIIKRLKMIY